MPVGKTNEESVDKMIMFLKSSHTCIQLMKNQLTLSSGQFSTILKEHNGTCIPRVDFLDLLTFKNWFKALTTFKWS